MLDKIRVAAAATLGICFADTTHFRIYFRHSTAWFIFLQEDSAASLILLESLQAYIDYAGQKFGVREVTTGYDTSFLTMMADKGPSAYFILPYVSRLGILSIKKRVIAIHYECASTQCRRCEGHLSSYRRVWRCIVYWRFDMPSSAAVPVIDEK